MSSLRPDDRSRKDRSRSRSRDHRSKSDAASERPSYSDYRESSYIYPEDDLNDRTRPGAPQASGALPYPDEGGIYPPVPGNLEQYSYDSYQPTYRTASPPKDSPYRSSHDRVDSNLPGAFPGAFPDDSRREKDKDPYAYNAEPRAKDEQDRFSFLPQKYMRKLTGSPGDNKERDNRSRKDRLDDDLAYGQPGVPPRPKAETDDLAYGKATGLPSTASQVMTTYNPPSTSGDDYYAQQQNPYGYTHHDPASPSVDQYGSRRSKEDVRYNDVYGSNPNIVTAEPRSRDDEKHRERRRDRSSDPRGSSDRLAVDTGGRKREKSRDRSRRREKSRERSRSHRREKSGDTLTVDSHRRHRSRSRDGRHSRKDKSPQPPTARMSGLSINTGLTVGGLAVGGLAGASLANAPPSPMLESYYGTYQDCSPMPSPLLLAAKSSDDNRALEALSPLGSDNEDDSRRRRRARFHDPEDITTQLAQALKGSRKPDTEPLIEILPSLTHDQVMKLRADYKALVKTGSDRKGVNIAKHIRARLKDEDPLLMKACYSVALGIWESEAYWANFWYQGDKTRRELLIESLMGRTNAEIRYIKDAFTDKKYDNSLTKCMKEELKEDKFKKAVLLVLDERRMEEYDHHGRLLPIDYALVDQDVADLRRSIKSEKGGETAMINIIVLRSDSHLRAILQEYERQYRANFARDALKKSGNLVGELLAHILNGVINRPVRDALLIHHATSASRKDDLRRELLISRLVRYHWDPHHMRAVKQAYRERYGRGMKDVVRDATSGEWGEFCGELCIARMPDDVRKFDKISYSTR